MRDQIVSFILDAFISRNRSNKIFRAFFLQRFRRYNLVGALIKWKKKFYINHLKDLCTQIRCNKLVYTGESYRTDMESHNNP